MVSEPGIPKRRLEEVGAASGGCLRDGRRENVAAAGIFG
jgi:hypothetical protein